MTSMWKLENPVKRARTRQEVIAAKSSATYINDRRKRSFWRNSKINSHCTTTNTFTLCFPHPVLISSSRSYYSEIWALTTLFGLWIIPVGPLTRLFLDLLSISIGFFLFVPNSIYFAFPFSDLWWRIEFGRVSIIACCIYSKYIHECTQIVAEILAAPSFLGNLLQGWKAIVGRLVAATDGDEPLLKQQNPCTFYKFVFLWRFVLPRCPTPPYSTDCMPMPPTRERERERESGVSFLGVRFGATRFWCCALRLHLDVGCLHTMK